MISTKDRLKKLPDEKGYVIFNLGGTAFVSSAHDGKADVMPASWVCPLNIAPFRMTAVVDGPHFTRELIEKSGVFALSVPTVQLADVVMKLGTVSMADDIEKLEKSGADLFTIPGFESIPLVDGCAAYAFFKVLPAPSVSEPYDLILGECLGVWADERVMPEGHVDYDKAPKELRTIHYLGAGHFRVLGEALDVPGYDE